VTDSHRPGAIRWLDDYQTHEKATSRLLLKSHDQLPKGNVKTEQQNLNSRQEILTSSKMGGSAMGLLFCRRQAFPKQNSQKIRTAGRVGVET
jgi:hypothetical protein